MKGLGRGRLEPIKRPDGTRIWRGVWTDANGRRRRQQLSTDKRVANHMLSAIIRKRDLVMHGLAESEGDPVLLRDVVTRWVESKDAGWSASHRRRTVTATEQVLQWLGRSSTATSVTVDQVEAYIRQRMTRDGASMRTAHLEVGALRTALGWAARRKMISGNPLAGLELEAPRGEDLKKSRRALGDEEIARLLQAARASEGDDGPRALLLYALLVTGARWYELVSTLWLDYTPASGRQPAMLRLRASQTKARRERHIPIPPGLALRLERTQAERGDSDSDSERIFMNSRGGHWNRDPGNFRLWLFRMLKAAGIPKRDAAGQTVDIHALRHTAITNWARSGMPFAHALKLSGIGTPHILARVYVHLGSHEHQAEMPPDPDSGPGAKTSHQPDTDTAEDERIPPNQEP